MSDPIPDTVLLYFQPKTEEIPIEINGLTFRFTVRGFYTEEFEEIASRAATAFERDGQGRPQARLNIATLNHLLLKDGIIDAPIDWTDANIRKLQGFVRDILLDTIYRLSDQVAGLKKKSGPSSRETNSTPPS